jgi:hypothetical protein
MRGGREDYEITVFSLYLFHISADFHETWYERYAIGAHLSAYVLI